ncbi:uncharacterized protein LOC120611028 isoform X2 [Pteropus medius]|uniref:uncharacterized protein LOC120611028 isoform X2 n=1 Tax=Pteropus vampyrus TaxID=132908 RepID=UPI00196A95F5|nr:uncharacterized protein LOC120611028 isoform X2 [Pteropus giganteus]
MQAEEEVIWKEGVTKHSCPAIRPAHLGPSPAQPEQLLRSDEHCRALQGRGCARLGPPINAGPRLLAPQPGPGGPQLPRRHPIAVCDPYAFLHWRKVWANRQLYWFRSASMRLHSAAYGLSVTSWRRAKGFPSRAAHSKSLRASLSRPCSRAMSELQVFQGSCGRNEHRIRAQHWGPGARPFTTRSHFILEALLHPPSTPCSCQPGNWKCPMHAFWTSIGCAFSTSSPPSSLLLLILQNSFFSSGSLSTSYGDVIMCLTYP